MNKIEVIKVLLAVAAFTIGAALIVMGLWLPPIGTIDNSVLVAVGEFLTFSASVLGINYTYQFKLYQLKKRIDNIEKDTEE